jgi:predicted NBD/HSP70 family sugar kinase
MSNELLLQAPGVIPVLDAGFRPIALGNRAYQRAVAADPARVPLAIALERSEGLVTVFRTEVLPPGHRWYPATEQYVERLVKFLIWQVGGWRVVLGGPRELGESLARTYRAGGTRAFDVTLMERVYERPFEVRSVPVEQVPEAREGAVALGGHLDGCRIGFDLGASDYKLAAVKDGEAVFTTEIPWDPKNEPDPEFHFRRIDEGLRLAAGHLPRVDAIGGSAAGIYIDNKVMVASLFRAVPAPLFHTHVQPLFLRLRKKWGVPLEVANDGDVTALAGGMSLQATGILGIAMGSSQAVGFLDAEGKITGWLNELAFAPVDLRPNAPADEWSGDLGCGVQFFSQQAVVRLAPLAGIDLPSGHPAEQLKFVQELLAREDRRAQSIFATIGVCLGYALAQYAGMYDLRHALVLGRVTSGTGGDLILAKAREVLTLEFPELSERVSLHLPDEKSKRVGQAVAAASLPRLNP